MRTGEAEVGAFLTSSSPSYINRTRGGQGESPEETLFLLKKVCRDCIKPFLANNWKKGGRNSKQSKVVSSLSTILGLTVCKTRFSGCSSIRA